MASSRDAVARYLKLLKEALGEQVPEGMEIAEIEVEFDALLDDDFGIDPVVSLTPRSKGSVKVKLRLAQAERVVKGEPQGP